MDKKRMSVEELLSLIPEELLDRLGEETQVDHQVKKLSGKVILKLFLYALSSQKDLSWRILESIFSHYKFKQFAQLAADARADHSSLATRISNIRVEYFAKIHQALNEHIQQRFNVQKIGGYKIIRFDSTLVSIAGTLLEKLQGIRHGVTKKYQTASDPVDLKFTIGFDGLSPVQAKVFDQPKYASEDLALKEVIEQHSFGPKDIAVFDRGLSKRQTFDQFTDDRIVFISRLKTQKGNFRHEYIETITEIPADQPLETEGLWIHKDQRVYLFNKHQQKSKYAYRVITAKRKADEKVMHFLTNEMQLSAQQVASIYKYRWDIEVFFKFLKQEFGFRHLLARNRNGIEVLLYMTLICFSLIYLYHALNQFESFKVAKIRFAHELDFEVMKIIVEICKGDPNLLYLLNPM